ncbi:MAG: antibiotic biosynthesis monooxygenase [Desulfobulbaceae bacterium A2]|nr:MAG: antibiotic biosynthesis monooxygenase [Desulfobulbaceae bacterium A2]
MLAVVVELHVEEQQRQEYLQLAARLGQQLEQIDGFLSIERFESLSQPGRILSLSYWRDEEAVARWRQQEAHRAAQSQARNGLLRQYRFTVLQALRQYGKEARDQAPVDSRSFHGV